MKGILCHLTNKVLEGLECFVLFLSTYKHDILFLHTWSIASSQPCPMALISYCRNKICPNNEHSVPYGSSSNSLVFDKLESLII